MACLSAYAQPLPAAQKKPVVGQATSSVRPVDPARLQQAGIRTLTSRHLTLYTDLASSPEIDRLPQIFDQAVPQWAEYFHTPRQRTADWRAEACLIGDRRPFDAAGLMPAGDDDQFAHGFSIGNRMWLYDQPSDYYRRHLLLHEGTHAFMASMLGGCGPGWYMEGMAELLATHKYDEQTGQLTLRIMPASRDEVPMLGRIKLVRDAFAEGRLLPLDDVLEIDNSRPLGNEAYAWCWAAAVLFDSDPRYQDRFRRLRRHVTDRQFNAVFRRQYAENWADLEAEWQAFIATLDHGYDFERMAIAFRPGRPLVGRREVTIAADRGWQSSGVWLEAGRAYRIAAAGQYRIAEEPTPTGTQPWPCEPGGVTIEYHDGEPLGILLGAIDVRTSAGQGGSQEGQDAGRTSRAADAALADATFVHPLAIGLSRTFTPAASGTLYLRVNDAAGRLADNEGRLTVTIEPAR